MQNLLKMHGLEGETAKGVATPWDKQIEKAKDADVELDPEAASLFRTGAGIAQYLAQDRYDIQFAVKECRREAATPTERAKARLKRVARYLVSHPRVVIRFRFLTPGERGRKDVRTVRMFVDASHAGCSRTRKSTTSGVGTRGPHNLGEFVATQLPISISSGESEFYALVRGCVELKFLNNLVMWLFEGDDEAPATTPELVSDATAALGAASRLGVGRRMKHIDTQHVFLQKEVNDGMVKLKKIGTEIQTADVGTKALNEPKSRKLLEYIGVRFLMAAILAAQAKVANGEVTLEKGAVALVEKMTYRVQVVTEETYVRMQDIAANGISATDLIIIIIITTIWEILKELLKVMMVGKIRDSCVDIKMCCCARKKKNMKKVVHMMDMKTKAHTRRSCRALKNVTREVKGIELCAKCDHEELENKVTEA